MRRACTDRAAAQIASVVIIGTNKCGIKRLGRLTETSSADLPLEPEFGTTYLQDSR